MERKKHGKFLVIEGPDGSGKTTQMELLCDYLKGRGVEVVKVREPGGTVVGEGIRDLFKSNFGQTDPMAEALMMLAARQQLTEEVIRPALERGAWVLSDRHTPSLFAYQGGGHRLGFSSLIAIRNALGRNVLDADLTVFLTADKAVRKERLAIRGLVDKIDSASDCFFKRVEDAYTEMSEGSWNLQIGLIRTADGNGTPEEVHQSIIEELFWVLQELEG